jgi:hypothetical protein
LAKEKQEHASWHSVCIERLRVGGGLLLKGGALLPCLFPFHLGNELEVVKPHNLDSSKVRLGRSD